MSPTRQPLFLVRRSYRRRRLRDAARMLPILGLFLFLLPVIWGAPGRATSRDGIYLFGAWIALIAIARLLAPLLARHQEDEES